MLGVSQEAGIRYHDRGYRAQILYDFSCVVEPTHMGVASGEIAMRLRVARILLDRKEQFRRGLIELPAEEMRGAQPRELDLNRTTFQITFLVRNKPRIGKTLKPMGSISRRPQVSAAHPAQGDRRAVTSCGPTIQADDQTASLSARFVTAAAAIGSIAALARWNKTAQTAKAISRRSNRNCHDRSRGRAESGGRMALPRLMRARSGRNAPRNGCRKGGAEVGLRAADRRRVPQAICWCQERNTACP